MATILSGKGRIELFEDFLGPEWLVAETLASGYVGPFRAVGVGMNGTDGGVTVSEVTPCLSGVGILTSSATAGDVTAMVTAKCFDVAKMGTLILETRVQFPDLLTKSCWIGFCNTNDDAETIPASITSTTTTLTASNQIGFCFDNNATDIDGWYYTYKGGTTTGDTVSANQLSGVTLVAADYDVLRIEVDPDGTGRWYINGVLKKTLAGAISTSTDVAAFVGVESEGSAVEYMDVDYIYVSANRDWTV